jgi:hypothetical protein
MSTTSTRPSSALVQLSNNNSRAQRWKAKISESADIERKVLNLPFSNWNNLLVRNYSQNETEARCVEDSLLATALHRREFLGHKVNIELSGYSKVVPVQDKRMDRPNLSRCCFRK